jgi:rare lipoprotein A
MCGRKATTAKQSPFWLVLAAVRPKFTPAMLAGFGGTMGSRISEQSASRLVMAALLAATASACTHTTAINDTPLLLAAVEPEAISEAAPARHERRAARRRQTAKSQNGSQAASDGLASFYRHGGRTASGERFNPGALTAAHRTLPFGTRVRVTNVATGQTVMVRVTDRGPFIHGRVIDLSYAAAESLGMVRRGVAQVKLDVVQ